MWPEFAQWIALFIKWFHVVAGVAWIGASFYFTWLDNSLATPPAWKKDAGIKGDLWAIHGGGFYEVAKYQVGPQQLPEKLHWFKWEAYTTWLTGSLLLIWTYYFNAQAYLIDPSVMQLEPITAVGIGIFTIALGVLSYELLLRSPLAKTPIIFGISIALLAALFFYGFCAVFSGRGAFIHMGALIGSIMVNNVFYKIIPGQRKMVAQVTAGEAVDPAPGLEGKRRSIHNNYFTLPIIFLMISNHYPMIYQHQWNWLVGLVVMLISVVIRHYFNLKHTGVSKPSNLVVGALAMIVLAAVLSWSGAPSPTNEANLNQQSNLELANVHAVNELQLAVPEQQALQIIVQRCATCHSQQPSDDVFTIAPSGVVLDNWSDIERWKAQIVNRAVTSADMPFMNKTNMTDDERKVLQTLLNQQ